MLKFIVLNGPLQGEEAPLFEGQKIGSEDSCDFILKESKLSKESLEVSATSTGQLMVSSSSAIIEIGGEHVSELHLIPGLIFSIGETGFSVQEEDEVSVVSDDFDLKTALGENKKVKTAITPLKAPLKLNFVRGNLINTSMLIPWSPFAIGTDSTLYHFADDKLQLEGDLIVFEKSKRSNSKEALLKPQIGNIISINQEIVSKPTIVSDGDFVEFSNTAFYIEIR